jgi:four helix bundle protein
MSRKSCFEDLECWKAGRAFRLFACVEVAKKLPSDERYRLADQLIRCARSITANIAEGYGRYHYLDEAKFLSNSRGSAQETLDHLICAYDEGMIDEALLDKGRALADNAIALINGYRSYLIRRTKEQQ